MPTIPPGTTPGFHVDTSALTVHQQHLGAVLDQLADALRVALETNLPEEAFGPFGAPLAATIKPTAGAAQDAFERAVHSVSADRDSLLQTVRDYDDLERVNTRTLRNAGGAA
jgi:hypothetical protein